MDLSWGSQRSDWHAHPSGRQVIYNLDSADRVSSVQNVPGGGNYASISYTALGGIDTMTMGNTVMQSVTWNDRLQPTQLQVNKGTQNLLTLGFFPCPSSTAANCTTGNNGSLQSQSISFPALNGAPALNVTQAYSYDPTAMTRLASQSYGYVGNGNRYVTQQGASLASLTPETPIAPSWYSSTNRINTWTYDPAGNVTNMNGAPARSFTYDAENRQVSATIGGATATYSYDGNGLRVSKTGSGGTTTYVYDAFGNLAAEYGGSGASPCGASSPTCYVTSDHLGSTRMLTDSSGSTNVRRYDYLPFGEEILAGPSGQVRTTGMGYSSSPDGLIEKFTGQARDAADSNSLTGLDWFRARYLSSAQGRFQSADPGNAGANPGDPQTWNAYSYVGNNPLSYTDPDGESFFSVFAGIFAGLGTFLSTGNPIAGAQVGATVAGAFQSLENIANGQPPLVFGSSFNSGMSDPTLYEILSFDQLATRVAHALVS